MIKSHHTFILRQLFSTKKNCPRVLISRTKISPQKCLSSTKDKKLCACKRRRKDVDKYRINNN